MPGEVEQAGETRPQSGWPASASKAQLWLASCCRCTESRAKREIYLSPGQVPSRCHCYQQPCRSERRQHAPQNLLLCWSDREARQGCYVHLWQGGPSRAAYSRKGGRLAVVLR